jgi:hypothetical protein
VADNELREAEDDLDRAREQFRVALKAAHEAGATFSQVGDLTGRSRQRIAQLLKGESGPIRLVA